MRHLIHEIHRRSLWQVLGIYLGASWLVLQVVDTMAGALSLPDWSASFAFFLLVIGLPIVLATAFVQSGGAGSGAAAARGVFADEGVPESDRDPDGGDPVSPPPASVREDPPRLLTWRNAILGGVGAFALLGLLGGGWLASRVLGIGPAATLQARGVLDDEALIVLADFEAADPELSAAATEALRVDLSQSDAIRLADQSVIEDALVRMERDPATLLTPELAEEVGRREGAGGVIQGRISRAGEGYVFTAELVDAEGTTLTSQRETADGPGEVIAAIERLSRELRERIGESLGSIRAAEPLERVTTSDLKALELYSRAGRLEGRPGRGLALLEEAVARDSGFAMAWNAIAVKLRNRMAERARMLEAQTKAYEQRHRLTRRESHVTSAMYFLEVMNDPQRAAAEYEAILALDPDDETAINNLGVVYGELRRNERALPLYRRKVELAPDDFGTGYWNLIQTQVHLGDFEAAWRAVDSVAARWDDPVRALYVGSIVASNQGDLERARRLLDELLEYVDGERGFEARVRGDLGAVLATQGRLDEATRNFEAAAGIVLPGNPDSYWGHVRQTAWLELLVRERPSAALGEIEEARRTLPLDSLPPLDRPYGPLAEILARAGAVSQAHELMEELTREIDPEQRDMIRAEIDRARGEIALVEGRYPDAIDAFRASDRGYCTICALTGLAAAYDGAGQADSARAVYERYVETPFPDRYASYAYALGPALAPALERLGELHEAEGDLRAAAEYYAQFVDLWAEADEELQPRVRAAQARLEAIMSRIG